MNKIERKKMILAMEFICRQINDEEVFDTWLQCGVPDGEIKYGEWDVGVVEDYFIEDDARFAEFMGCFLRRMKEAKNSGGLYCDGVVSE